ncbi:DNA gyrase subunit B [Streptomyces phaeofaciens]
MSEDVGGYDAARIEVLEPREAIRKRPGMYVGSTGERGVYQMVFDVVGRAVNEVLAGRASAVDVTLTPDGGVRVADDGPGVPVEAAGHAGGPSLEELLTHLPTGAGAGGRHAAVVGMFIVGPCVTNALSSRLTAEVRREGMRWVQEYVRGVAVTAPVAVGPAAGSGTSIAFRPDPDVFETVECSFDVLAERLREVALLNRGLSVSLTDERPAVGPRSVRFHFPGGVRDLVASLDARSGAPLHADVVGFECEEPRMEGTVEVALRWCDAREERVRTYANSRPTPEGGTHAVGFREGMAAAVNAYARERRLLTAADPDLTADRIGEGLTAVVSVKLDHPEFEGATRGRLAGASVRSCVAEAVRQHLGAWLDEQPERAEAVVGRVLRSARRD